MQPDPPCLKRLSRQGHTTLQHPPNAPTLFPTPFSQGGGSQKERETEEKRERWMISGTGRAEGEDKMERGCGM